MRRARREGRPEGHQLAGLEDVGGGIDDAEPVVGIHVDGAEAWEVLGRGHDTAGQQASRERGGVPPHVRRVGAEGARAEADVAGHESARSQTGA